jgi:Leucine rich repeat N-terminal domain
MSGRHGAIPRQAPLVAASLHGTLLHGVALCLGTASQPCDLRTLAVTVAVTVAVTLQVGRAGAVSASACLAHALLLFALAVPARALRNGVLTLPDAKAALLTLQRIWRSSPKADGISAATTLAWSPDTDPCYDDWRGVQCACYSTNSTDTTDLPCEGEYSPHISGLQLPAPLEGNAPLLYGNLPDVFGHLRWLAFLDLSNHRLTGLVPASLFTHRALIGVNLDGNLLYGPVVPANVTELSPALESLDVRFNMLSGELPEALCSLAALLIDGNSMLCNTPPDCLNGGAIRSALSTGLRSIGADYRACGAPAPACVAPPPLADFTDTAVPAEYAGELCKLVLSRGVIGDVPLSLDFSTLTGVDALVLSLTDHALTTYSAWFWLHKDVQPLLQYHPVRASTPLAIMSGALALFRARVCSASIHAPACCHF